MMPRTDEWTEPQVRAAHRGLAGVGAGLAGVGALADFTPLVADVAAFDAAAHAGYTMGLLCAGGAAAHRRWYFSPGRVFRRELGGPTGWLDGADLEQTAGASAVQRAAGPTALTGATPIGGTSWRRGRGSVAAAGFCVGRLVSGGRLVRGRRVYSPWTRGFAVLGPQGSGKTQFLVNVVLDSPGAAVVPSTKPELVVATRALRERVGPTAVFNPAELGEVGSDFAWDPLTGCTDPATADRRAWALVRGAGGAVGVERADFWAGKAAEILRCYLLAAALERLDMLRVMGWANDPDRAEPVAILTRHEHHVPPGWLATLQTHLRAAPNTRTGYFATVTSCVGFIDSPTVAAACTPGGAGFDLERFLVARGTLYLIGAAGDRRLAPLLTALTEYLFDTAQRIAARQPGGRLSPALNFILDEVANTTPVPLDRWAADSRGWGITVGAVVQSLAQFATTWGEHRADVIWENLPTKIVLPGVTNTADLQALAYLAGQRWVQRTTHGESDAADGRATRSTRSISRSSAREPVVAGHTISAMPRWHAYVLGLGRHPAVVRYEPGYARIRREQRRPPAAPPAPRAPTAPPTTPRHAAPAAGAAQVIRIPTGRGGTP